MLEISKSEQNMSVRRRRPRYFPKPSEQYQLLKWVRLLVPTHTVTNFKEDWRDGIVLCALIEGITPGACPRYDVLHPKQEFLNISLGLKLASTRLGIKTDLTAPDILNMKDGIEVKLQSFVAKLHTIYLLLSKMKPKLCYCSISSKASLQSGKNDTFKNCANCFVKGMGLLMGVRGREACFNIYFHIAEPMDIIIEIKGEGYHCKEQLTLLSPRRKELCDYSATAPLTAGRINSIPLKYTIFPKKIAVIYVPPATGHYELSILSSGQHIFGSPFQVQVDSKRASNVAITYYRHLGTCISRRDSDFGGLDDGFTSFHPNSTNEIPNSGEAVKEVTEKIIKYTIFREYDIIELKPGVPLPQDPRTCNGTLSVSQTSIVYPEQSKFKMVHGIDIATKESTGNLGAQSDCSGNNAEAVDALHEASQMEKSTACVTNGEKTIPDGMIDELFQEERIEDSNGKCPENTKLEKGRHADSRVEPEGHENNVSLIHKYQSNEQEKIEVPQPDITIQCCNVCNAPISKIGKNLSHRVVTPRVPERLISDWEDLWTESGESIVKARVKEWENIKLSVLHY